MSKQGECHNFCCGQLEEAIAISWGGGRVPEWSGREIKVAISDMLSLNSF